jgi:MFS family permease
MAFRQRFAVLGEPNFRRLYFARTISLVGDGIAPVAIAFAVLDLTGSVTDLGIVLAAHSLVVTALILVGGVYADRLSPRVSMLGSDLVRALVVGLIAVLLLLGHAEIWQLAILYAIEGAATAFFNPASIAIVPQVVSEPRLQEANALLSLSWSVGKVIGPALAGVLLALGDPGWALAADALTFALSAAFLLGLRAPGLAVAGPRSSASCGAAGPSSPRGPGSGSSCSGRRSATRSSPPPSSSSARPWPRTRSAAPAPGR